MSNMKHRRLQELDKSDFSIVDGEPDIRGWDVRIKSGQKIGEVEELILDAQERKVRYMVVDLDDDEVDVKERKVLIPIGLAQLDNEDDDVILPNIREEQLSSLPQYDEDRLDPETERRICTILGRNSEPGMNQGGDLDAGFYKHDYYKDNNLFRNRMQEASSAASSEESEYERGLRLWEQRNEGGIIQERNQSTERTKEHRMETVRNRREAYVQRRYSDKEMREGRSFDDNGRDRSNMLDNDALRHT